MGEREIMQALRAAPRSHFLPEDMRHHAEENRPLAIGYGQTNSQPSTVQRMLAWLEVKPGHRVLDVGAGSGWTTAILAYLVGPEGYVYAVERITELVDYGRAKCRELGISNVAFFQAGAVLGLAGHGPFDRILVSASADKLPGDLVAQLKRGGRMVVPVGHDVLVVRRQKNDHVDITKHAGFSFVPLIAS